jgi:ribosomal protein L7/L12
MIFIGIAIAFVVLVLWLAFQPKQGDRAANSPEPISAKHPPQDSPHQPQDDPNFRDILATPNAAPEPLRSPASIAISADLNQNVRQLVEQGRTITAIKLLRQQGMGLAEAKQYLDALVWHVSPADTAEPQPQAEIEEHVRRLIGQDQKIQAIKYVRQQLGYGLKEAKDYVESLDA